MAIVDSLMRNAVADVDVLRQMDAKGDDFSQPRTVDFVIVADDEERAALIRQFVVDQQYGEPSVQRIDDEHRILVRVQMPITQHVLMCVSAFMECLASLYGARYDGWGCVLQRRGDA